MIFKIAAVGILVTILGQVLKHSGREEHAFLISLAGLVLVVCAHYADVLLGCDYIRNAVVIAFCASELISICENAALMGVMPAPVKKIFDKIIDVMKSGKGDNNENN